ncbi:hypothetical protein [Pyrodictium occultum]|uniref:hypothetical protein n=1 Tax=Pyrodictium occultum TaxID=2309 RepID=UPI0014437D7F|nr:hypothetical protein [Pyrodictium occultum]
MRGVPDQPGYRDEEDETRYWIGIALIVIGALLIPFSLVIGAILVAVGAVLLASR